ncbi:hypothetical protein BDV33DRAFT_210419 [Aspergillus novoparasiticus]|uniref:DUF6536 domain-containing protein n=1 Tax=Aspergillus novoparasiticus TaxID=986946 RepID=A0A5N6E7G0_9EURO|nr:hypothetical protein BDV33DRAFT_210419 [Aspergillus novoparasiticus]
MDRSTFKNLPTIPELHKIASQWMRRPEYLMAGNNQSSPKRRGFSWKSIRPPFSKSGDFENGHEWIKGALICTWITGFILALNIILALVAGGIGSSRAVNKGQFQMVELYAGNCTKANRDATGLHLLINILSTLLLGASNYVMQCLGAPSRKDVDAAHQRRRWLDIGTFSVRNLRVMDWRRRVLWTSLLVSSLPIHMIYNAVISPSISTLGFGVLTIPSNLLPTESLVYDEAASSAFYDQIGSTAMDIRSQIFNGTFENMTSTACVKSYAVDYNTKMSTLVLVADRKHLHNASSLMGSLFSSQDVGVDYYSRQDMDKYLAEIGNDTWSVLSNFWSYRVWNFSSSLSTDSSFGMLDYWFQNLYFSDPAINTTITDQSTLAKFVYNYNPTSDGLREYLDNPAHWINSSWAADLSFQVWKNTTTADSNFYGSLQTPVLHCLSKKGEERCRLLFSPPIAITVILCNVVKVVCMALTSRVGRRSGILLTVGDAVSSFLTCPDMTTKGRCMMGRADMTKGPQHWDNRVQSDTEIPMDDSPRGATSLSPSRDLPRPSLPPRKKRWRQAVSPIRWMLTLSWFVACIITLIVLFVMAVAYRSSFSAAWNLGLGQASPLSMLDSASISKNPIALILLANTPQIVLSILYFLANSLLTCMLVAAEWDRYATQRRPLRVSWPQGKQRSTYYLTLPYRYSIPMLIISALLHWLLSQSIFFVDVQAYDVHGQTDPYSSARACGFSPMAIFFTIILGSFVLILLFTLGAKRLRSHAPLVSHCSAAISAACHPPADDTDAALKPVMWGEINVKRFIREAGGQELNPLEEQQAEVSVYENRLPVSVRTGYGHCSFTSREVETPHLDRLYC